MGGSQCSQLVSKTKLFGTCVAFLIAHLVRVGNCRSNDIVALLKRNALIPGGIAAHRTQTNSTTVRIVFFFEADRHSFARSQKDGLLSVRQTSRNQIVVLVDCDSDDSTRHDVGEVLERRLLYNALPCGEEDELAFLFKVAHGKNGADIFARLQVEQALHGFALACRTDVGNFVHLDPVHAAGVGKAEQVGVGRVDDELRNEIFFARLHAHAAGAAAPLRAIDGDRSPLEVALVAHCDGNLLVGDEVFRLQLGALVENLRAPCVAVLVANLFKLFDDDRAQLDLAGQDGFVFGDALPNQLEFGEQFVDGELRQPVELQFENCVDLPEREALLFVRKAHAVEGDDNFGAFAPCIEVLASLGSRTGSANDFDHGVEVVECNIKAFYNVRALASLAEQEGRSPLHDVDAMIDEGLDCLIEAQLPRLPVEHREEDHGEALLHGCVLVELVEHNLGLSAPLQLDDDPHSVAIALVAHVADVIHNLVVYQLGDALDEPGLVDLVGNFGDDDRLAFLGQVLKRSASAHEEPPAPAFVSGRNAGLAIEKSASREVGPLHMLEHFSEAAVRIFHQGDGGVDDLGQIVGRNVGGHAHRDSVRPVDDQGWNPRGEHRGLVGCLIEVGRHIDGFHVDIGHHFFGDALHAALGIAIRRRWAAIDRAKVSLPIDQRIT